MVILIYTGLHQVYAEFVSKFKKSKKGIEEACLPAQIHNEVPPPMQGHVLDSCQLRQPAMVVGTRQLGG